MLTFVSWVVVLLGSAATLFLVGRSVLRRGLALGREAAAAEGAVDEAQQRARAAFLERSAQARADQDEADRAATAAPGAARPLVGTAGLRWGRHDDAPGSRPASDQE